MPAAARDDFEPELIVARRTSRVAYDGRPVPAPVLAELADICSAYGNAFLSSSDPALVSWVLALNRDMLFEDMTNAKTRREVGSWLRFSEREAGPSRHDPGQGALWFIMRLGASAEPPRSARLRRDDILVPRP